MHDLSLYNGLYALPTTILGIIHILLVGIIQRDICWNNTVVMVYHISYAFVQGGHVPCLVCYMNRRFMRACGIVNAFASNKNSLCIGRTLSNVLHVYYNNVYRPGMYALWG